MPERDVLPENGIQVFIPPAARERMPHKPTGMEVLVIEDDSDVRTLLRLALRLDGHRVIEAATPGEGLARAAEAHPDLILLDVVFPRADGIAALRSLRATAGTNDIAIILVSGRSHAEDQMMGLQEGADLYLIKPFDPLALLTTIREFAAMSPAERSERRVKELTRLRLLTPPLR